MDQIFYQSAGPQEWQLQRYTMLWSFGFGDFLFL